MKKLLGDGHVAVWVALVLLILGGLWWAIYQGQFEGIEQEGERILHND